MRTLSSENKISHLNQQDDSIDPIVEWPDPSISDSERIRRVNRRFQEWYKHEVELKRSRQ
jgi:hypothetical protein